MMPPTDCENMLQKLRVLYVEDDADTRQELTRFLKKRVGHVSSALNGAEALTLVRQMTFDTVITDLRMPDTDGIAFVKSLREAGSQMPVIITSAFSDTETILQTVDLGIVKYCVKPVNTEDLMLVLERIATDLHCRRIRTAFSSPDLDREQRLNLEKSIRSETAHLMKALTGKGPKDVQVIFSADTLDLCITEAFTPLELTVLQNPANAGLVASLRRMLYGEARQAFEERLADLWGAPVSLIDVRTDTQLRTDRLMFRL